MGAVLQPQVFQSHRLRRPGQTPLPHDPAVPAHVDPRYDQVGQLGDLLPAELVPGALVQIAEPQPAAPRPIRRRIFMSLRWEASQLRRDRVGEDFPECFRGETVSRARITGRDTRRLDRGGCPGPKRFAGFRVIADVLQRGKQVDQAFHPEPAEPQNPLNRDRPKILRPLVHARGNQAIDRANLQIQVGQLHPPRDRRQPAIGDGHRHPCGPANRADHLHSQLPASIVSEPLP